MSIRTKASLSIAIGAGFWGMFWIPLRYLDEGGMTGLWAVAMAMGCAALFALPFALWRSRPAARLSKGTMIVGFGVGCSAVLYFIGIIQSDVIRVIFLFYLLPVWATLTARVLYGDPIRPLQMAAIALALVGLYFLLGGDGGIPLPRNVGDWCGLAAGFLWALSLTIIRGRDDLDPHLNAAAPFVIGGLIAGVLAIFVASADTGSATAVPNFETFLKSLPIALLFGGLLLWPSLFGQVWGAQHISAPSAALLTMTEILVATLSSWMLIGSSLTTVSLFGGVLIVIAALIDLLAGFKQEVESAAI